MTELHRLAGDLGSLLDVDDRRDVIVEKRTGPRASSRCRTASCASLDTPLSVSRAASRLPCGDTMPAGGEGGKSGPARPTARVRPSAGPAVVLSWRREKPSSTFDVGREAFRSPSFRAHVASCAHEQTSPSGRPPRSSALAFAAPPGGTIETPRPDVATSLSSPRRDTHIERRT